MSPSIHFLDLIRNQKIYHIIKPWLTEACSVNSHERANNSKDCSKKIN
jgi:hypothetical protein